MRHEIRPERRRRAALRLLSGPLRAPRKRVAEPLKRGVFLVPMTITSLGLLAGFYSIVSSVNGHFETAAVMIMVAFVCDGLDGRVARASRTSSQFGVEYDSLADVVAFGVAPAALVYIWGSRPLAAWSWVLSGVFVVCAALRLARFNVQAGTTDKRRFVGLPVPGAAAVIAGWVLAYSYFELDSPLLLGPLAMILTVALAGLMISRVPYPSFKAIDFRQRGPVEILAGITVVVAFLVTLPQLSAFLLATAYMLSGPILFLRGERITSAAPVLRPVPGNEQQSAPQRQGPAELEPR